MAERKTKRETIGLTIRRYGGKGMTETSEIKRIQKEIVTALEAGQDTAELLEKLAAIRAEIARDWARPS